MDYLYFLFFIMTVLIFFNLFLNKNIWSYDKQNLNTWFNKELFSVKGVSKPSIDTFSTLNKNLLVGSPFRIDKNCVSPLYETGDCVAQDKKSALESCKNYNNNPKSKIKCLGVNYLDTSIEKKDGKKIYIPKSNTLLGCVGPNNENYIDKLSNKTLNGEYDCLSSDPKYSECCKNINYFNKIWNVKPQKDINKNLKMLKLNEGKDCWLSDKIKNNKELGECGIQSNGFKFDKYIKKGDHDVVGHYTV